MSAPYGIPAGGLVFAWYVHVGFLPPSAWWAGVCVTGAVAFLFVAYKSTFALAWNRRADLLRRQAQGNAEVTTSPI